MRTFREDGPWASDDAIVTNRYSLRSALAIAQPRGQLLITNSWDAAGRVSVPSGTPGTFTYNYASKGKGGYSRSIGMLALLLTQSYRWATVWSFGMVGT